ncbi:MAG: prolyl oligopeptidase family serine peptidase [Planctomycetales bacterium]
MNRVARSMFAAALLFCCGSGLCAAEVVDGVILQREISYHPGGHRMMKLDLAVPEAKSEKPLPVIVLIHGGGWVDGDKSSFATIKPRNQANVIDYARLGFAAATINYRLSKEAIYPSGLEDCECAIRWLRAHAKEHNLDPARIGAWGNSAGGHLALMLAISEEPSLAADAPWREHSSRVQCAISDSGPIDMVAQYHQGVLRGVVNMFMGGPPEGELLKAYQKCSPSTYADRIKIPLMLIYGVEDNQVPIETADKFVVELQKNGLHDLSYHRLATVGHCPHSLIQVPWTRTVVNEFFARTLKLKDPAPQK